ncbi:MAG TPA: HNH endonuclease signature motif containing protein [Propionibacteriaceae bacterium]|nr:HNH endonuclease signature motif containing protein [Propionibacteriaceae bacterium]
MLFTRLLTDDGGRLLDVTELGRYPSARLAQAIKVRAGTCRYPTCSVPADRCDLDHHEPVPKGPTSAANLDPLCRRHHRGKTFAWLASVRDDHGVDWTMPDAVRYRCVDDPLPTAANVGSA